MIPHRHQSVLTDQIEYRLPLGGLGDLFGSGKALKTIEAMFAYRHGSPRMICNSILDTIRRVSVLRSPEVADWWTITQQYVGAFRSSG